MNLSIPPHPWQMLTRFQIFPPLIADFDKLPHIGLTYVLTVWILPLSDTHCYPNEKQVIIKDGLSLQIKKIHIPLYFIATQYSSKYALVEDIDNLTWSYILKIILLVLGGNLKVGKSRLWCFYLQNSTQIPSLEAFFIIYLC